MAAAFQAVAQGAGDEEEEEKKINYILGACRRFWLAATDASPIHSNSNMLPRK
jgi:hypothetical protein